MAANRILAKHQGLPESDVSLIDCIHDVLKNFILHAVLNKYPEDYVLHTLKEHEFTLQDLWKFERDESKHYYHKIYLFKKQWYGRVFRCKDTGTTFTIPISVIERDFFSIGEGYIDVGVWEGYYRVGGNIEELRE